MPSLSTSSFSSLHDINPPHSLPLLPWSPSQMEELQLCQIGIPGCVGFSAGSPLESDSLKTYWPAVDFVYMVFRWNHCGLFLSWHCLNHLLDYIISVVLRQTDGRTTAWFHTLIFEVLVVVMMVRASGLELCWYAGNITKQLRLLMYKQSDSVKKGKFCNFMLCNTYTVK